MGLAILFRTLSPPPCHPSLASLLLRSKSNVWVQAKVLQDCLVRDCLFTVPPVACWRERFVTNNIIILECIWFFLPSHLRKKENQWLFVEDHTKLTQHLLMI